MCAHTPRQALRPSDENKRRGRVVPTRSTPTHGCACTWLTVTPLGTSDPTRPVLGRSRTSSCDSGPAPHAEHGQRSEGQQLHGAGARRRTRGGDWAAYSVRRRDGPKLQSFMLRLSSPPRMATCSRRTRSLVRLWKLYVPTKPPRAWFNASAVSPGLETTRVLHACTTGGREATGTRRSCMQRHTRLAP